MRIAIDIILGVLIVAGVVRVFAMLYGVGDSWWARFARDLVLLCCLVVGIGGIGMAAYSGYLVAQTGNMHGLSLVILYLIIGLAALIAAKFAFWPKKK